jgi:ribosomal protein S18 acetylase RimI-like enzyme
VPKPIALDLRKASIGDVDVVVAIIREASDWLAAEGLTWLRTFPGAAPERVANGTVWLASLEGGNEPVATIALESTADPEFWTPDEADALFVHGLAVQRSAGGLGVGSRLLDFAGDQAARCAIPWIRLDCNKSNNKLQAYYARQGFAHVRTVDLPHRNSGALFQRPAARSGAVHGAAAPAGRFTVDLATSSA